MIAERRHLIAAVTLHILIFLLLFASAFFARKIEPPKMIEATIVSLDAKEARSDTTAPPQPQPPVEQPAEQPPEPKPTPTPPKPEKKQPTPDELKAQQQKKEEQQRKDQEKKEEQQRKAAEQQEIKRQAEELRKQKDLELKADAERKRQDALAKKAEEERQKAEAARLKAEEAERQKQEKAAEAERQKQEIARKKQEEIDRQKQLEAERQRLAKEEADRQAAEQKRRADQMAAAMAAELQGRIQAAQADWGSVLAARIRKFWQRPPASPDAFHCVVAMQLAQKGDVIEVISAKVTQSCGSEPLDRSVEAAVIKASPMPPPADPAAFVPNISVTFCPTPNACK